MILVKLDSFCNGTNTFIHERILKTHSYFNENLLASIVVIIIYLASISSLKNYKILTVNRIKLLSGKDKIVKKW